MYKINVSQRDIYSKRRYFVSLLMQQDIESNLNGGNYREYLLHKLQKQVEFFTVELGIVFF